MPAAGKGTFRELLEEELDRHGISHRSHSLSDELRQEARFRGLPVDREVLRRLGHELRLKHASDVLSDRVLKRIAFDLRQGLHPEVFV
ncbi:MAG: hypothetical protein KGJ86_12020, partial [Chloroflexota bacterium]|nr:hypothetical protein [Chloroflexota bacterium]